jgi:hypothetical protein
MACLMGIHAECSQLEHIEMNARMIQLALDYPEAKIPNHRICNCSCHIDGLVTLLPEEI